MPSDLNYYVVQELVFYLLSRLCKENFLSPVCTLQSTQKLFFVSTIYKKYYTYGLHSFLYMASKLWNSLPDSFRMSEKEYIYLTSQCSHCFLPSHPGCQVMQGLLKIQLFQNLFIGNTVKNNSISESCMEIFERSSL